MKLQSTFFTVLLFLTCGLYGQQCGTLDFYDGTWENGGTGWNVANDTDSMTITCGATTIGARVTFGRIGNGGYNGVSFLNIAAVNGFGITTNSSESIDQQGDGLTNALVMDVVFSEPVWIQDWVIGDIDSYWVTTGINAPDREWQEAVYFEGWSSGVIGSLATGDIDPDFISHGSAIYTGINSSTGVDGKVAVQLPQGQPALDPDAELKLNIGTEAMPLKAFRMYMVNQGNVNISTFNNITIQNAEDGPMKIFTNITVPVELIDFRGTNYGRSNRLNWTTASESNNEKFIIEKSNDGNVWNFLTEVKANNHIQGSDYEYLDEELDGKNIYYRLSQVDFDSRKTSLKSIAIKNNMEEPIGAIYPNPANDYFLLSNHLGAKVKIYNYLYEDVTRLTTQIEYANSDLKFDTSSLSAGVYYIQANETIYKLIILK